MISHLRNASKKGFTLVELLVVVLILGILTSIALPAYLSSVNVARQGTANANARSLSISVQAQGVRVGSYDSTLADYAADMGGHLPVNPCTDTTTGYSITVSGLSASVAASAGTGCGTWTPLTYPISMN